jgi:hypothetical protein
MNMHYHNLTTSKVTIREIGTKLVNIKIQVPVFYKVTTQMPPDGPL